MEDREYTTNFDNAQSILQVLRSSAQILADETEIEWDSFNVSSDIIDEMRNRVEFLQKRSEEAILHWEKLETLQKEVCVDTLLYCYSILFLLDRREKIESMLRSL